MKFIGFADEVSPEVTAEAPQEAQQKAQTKSVTPEYVESVAQRYGVNPDLARGIFRVETSSGANVATSPKGAMGPMQVMPDTFKEVYPEGDINNPEDNVEAGVRYLARAQKDLGTDDPRLIAAAYHAGIGAVKKAGGVPNTNDGIMSTSDYVDRVSGSGGPREGLRRIAAKKMTFVGFSDEEDPAYSRFNPPKRSVEAVDAKSPSAPISELPGDLWEAAKGLGASLQSAWAGLVEGGDPANIDYGNAAVKEAKDRALKSAAEPGAKDPYIDFAGIKLTRDQVRTMDQSLAFSVLSMGASITGALIGSLGGPGTALAGATAFGGRAAYNMDANSVARQMRDGMDAAAKQQRGEPLTDEEFAAIVKSPDMQDAAKKVGIEWNKRGSAMGEIQTHAAHEALWEGLGNVATMGFGAFIAKEAMKRGIVKPILGAIGMGGSEVLTEWPTQQGQQRAESRLGLTDEPPRQYDNWEDWATSFEEVAGPTLAQTALMGGGAYVGGRVAGAVSGKPKADVDLTTEPAIGPDAEQVEMPAEGAVPQGSGAAVVQKPKTVTMYHGGEAGSVMTNPDLSRDNTDLSGDNSLPVMPGTQERDLGAIAEDSDRAKLAKLRERQMGAIQESGRDVAVEQADALTQAQGFDEPQVSPLRAAFERAQKKKAIRAEAQQIQAEAAQRVAAGQPVADLAERARNAMAKFAALSAPVAPVGQDGQVLQQPVAGFADPSESAPVAQQPQEAAPQQQETPNAPQFGQVGEGAGALPAWAPTPTDWRKKWRTLEVEPGKWRIAGLQNANPFSPAFDTEAQAEVWADQEDAAAPASSETDSAPVSQVSDKTKGEVEDEIRQVPERESGDAGVASGQEGGGPQPSELNIGDKTWHAGDEVTITSNPYALHGGQWQDAVTDSGKKVTIKTRAQSDADTQRNRQEWADQQEGFRKLKKRSVATAPATEQQPQGTKNELQETPKAAEEVSQSDLATDEQQPESSLAKRWGRIVEQTRTDGGDQDNGQRSFRALTNLIGRYGEDPLRTWSMWNSHIGSESLVYLDGPQVLKWLESNLPTDLGLYIRGLPGGSHYGAGVASAQRSLEEIDRREKAHNEYIDTLEQKVLAVEGLNGNEEIIKKAREEIDSAGKAFSRNKRNAEEALAESEKVEKEKVAAEAAAEAEKYKPFYAKEFEKKPTPASITGWFSGEYKGKTAWTNGSIIDLSGTPPHLSGYENRKNEKQKPLSGDAVDQLVSRHKAGATATPFAWYDAGKPPKDKWQRVSSVFLDAEGELKVLAEPLFRYFSSKFKGAKYRDTKIDGPVLVFDGTKMVGMIMPLRAHKDQSVASIKEMIGAKKEVDAPSNTVTADETTVGVELKNIEVTRKTYETDANGNRRELEGVKEPADKALADIDQQISAIRMLLACLNS